MAHDNYPTAELFASEIEATFYEERALDMVDGPFTRSEAAERCRCKPEELCPGPLAGIDESDKIRTIYDGSKGGANAHIQAHTGEKTTAPMVGDCLHWLGPSPSTSSPTSRALRRFWDVHQPVQGQSPGAEGPERDPRSTSLPPRAKRPDRGMGRMETSGGLDVSRSTPSGKGPLPGAEGPDRRAIPPNPPWHGTPWGEQGGTPDVAAADTWGNLHHPQGGCHQGPQAYKSAPERLEIPGGLHPEAVVGQQSGHVRHGLGTTVLGKKGILGAQTLVLHLPSGGLALSLCGRLLLGADWDATAILATLLALGVPLSWKKTALSPINTWLGFVVDPITPCVLLAPVKHVIILATLKRLAQGDIFTSKEVEQALGRIQWATSACPLTKPFLQPFWSWKKACTTSGRPPKLVRALAILLGKLFNQRFPLASPFAPTLPWTGASDAGAGKQADHAWVGGWCSDVSNPDKSRVKWFQHRITPEGEPWAFTTGDPQRAIAALELFGLLLLVRAVLLCAAGSASHTGC